METFVTQKNENTKNKMFFFLGVQLASLLFGLFGILMLDFFTLVFTLCVQ